MRFLSEKSADKDGDRESSDHSNGSQQSSFRAFLNAELAFGFLHVGVGLLNCENGLSRVLHLLRSTEPVDDLSPPGDLWPVHFAL